MFRKPILSSCGWLVERCRNVQRFRSGLVFKAHRIVYHSTLGLRVIRKKKKNTAGAGRRHPRQQREFFMDNLLVRIHFILVIIRWTGLATW